MDSKILDPNVVFLWVPDHLISTPAIFRLETAKYHTSMILVLLRKAVSPSEMAMTPSQHAVRGGSDELLFSPAPYLIIKGSHHPSARLIKKCGR